MDFTKDGDPSGVKALLDQLRNSQAFNKVSKPVEPTKRPEAAATVSQSTQSITERLASGQSSAGPPSSVAALLAKLQPYGSIAPRDVEHAAEPDVQPTAEPPKASPARRDYRNMTVQQALPQLYDLSSEPGFVASFKRLREDQNRVEQKLWDERTAIIQRHEEKLKNARARAALLRASGGLLQEETNLKKALDRELQGFQLNTVLPAWDAMATRQQEALEKLNVPTMFRTSVDTDRSRQQRIMQLLENIVE